MPKDKNFSFSRWAQIEKESKKSDKTKLDPRFQDEWLALTKSNENYRVTDEEWKKKVKENFPKFNEETQNKVVRLLSMAYSRLVDEKLGFKKTVTYEDRKLLIKEKEIWTFPIKMYEEEFRKVKKGEDRLKGILNSKIHRFNVWIYHFSLHGKEELKVEIEFEPMRYSLT
jgi:hypothetical protein